MSTVRAAALAAAGLGVAACVRVPPAPVSVKLYDSAGALAGFADLYRAGDSVRIEAHLLRLAPGRHGLHIHAGNACDPPTFTSAGPHLNPAGRQHGLQNPAGHHLGDLPNVEATGAEWTDLTFVAAGARLDDGPRGLFRHGGTTLVLHAGADDQMTDPSGNSGARIACGTIGKPEDRR